MIILCLILAFSIGNQCRWWCLKLHLKKKKKIFVLIKKKGFLRILLNHTNCSVLLNWMFDAAPVFFTFGFFSESVFESKVFIDVYDYSPVYFTH